MSVVDLAAIEAGFPRVVPVFPLPDVVLFPGALLPLHVFENRYRTMLRDAMGSDRLIAMGLLEPCSKQDYESRPPFHETVCVGYVVHQQALDDGRSNLLLLGVSAARTRDRMPDDPYPSALVELLPDRLEPEAELDQGLGRVFELTASGGGPDEVRAQVAQFVDAERVPAAMVNTCALAAPLRSGDKLRLLEERDVARRLDLLVEFLERPWQWN